MSDSEDEVSERQLKIVLVGDSGCGKTCLTNRYCNNTFSKAYLPTAGVDFLLRRDNVQKTKNVTVHLWDVGGTSRKLLDKYIFNANIVLVIYDVTNEVSFMNVAGWISTIREIWGATGNPPVIALVGNKIDMEHKRIVKQDRQNKHAAELHVTSHFCSARTGEGVILTMQRIMADFLGLRLTRSQVESFHHVVRAEISTHTDSVPVVPKSVNSPSSSSICNIQ